MGGTPAARCDKLAATQGSTTPIAGGAQGGLRADRPLLAISRMPSLRTERAGSANSDRQRTTKRFLCS
jgi:hypothetical protein